MSLWFAYNGGEYYPFAEVVEAETAEQAAAAVGEGRYGTENDPIAVFPLDALAYRRDGEEGTAWLEADYHQ